jgi:hypothetical protein
MIPTEFVLTVGDTRQAFRTLRDLDGAFTAAVARTPPPIQITAETYAVVSGQGIGKSHAYRLANGNTYRRPLASWDTSSMELTAQ